MAPTSALGGKSSTFNAAINLAKVLLFFSVLFFKASVFFIRWAILVLYRCWNSCFTVCHKTRWSIFFPNYDCGDSFLELASKYAFNGM